MKKLSFLAVGIILFAASCSKKEIAITATHPQLKPISGPMSIAKDSNLVDSSYAAYLASYYNSDVFFRHSKSATTRVISDAYSVPDKNGDPALYVFNYDNDDGYVVISADFRYQPILMFGETGSFALGAAIPSMLRSWIGRMVENVDLIRSGLHDNTQIGYNGWGSLMGGNFGPPPYDPGYFVPADNGSGDYGGGADPCPSVSATIGPLMQTSWGQGCGYDTYTPTCTNIHSCNHKQTGCVATAMAQVIKYWSHPDSHNYHYYNMPNTYGNLDVAQLMYDAGVSVNMIWGCDESLASAEDIDNALKDDFDFEDAEYDSYHDDDYQIVINNLNAGKPLIFRGCTDESVFLWFHSDAGSCHAWVCDGYNMQGNTCNPDIWYHMNWGMNTPGMNGWSIMDDWNPDGWDRHWNYGEGFVHNIHP